MNNNVEIRNSQHIIDEFLTNFESGNVTEFSQIKFMNLIILYENMLQYGEHLNNKEKETIFKGKNINFDSLKQNFSKSEKDDKICIAICSDYLKANGLEKEGSGQGMLTEIGAKCRALKREKMLLGKVVLGPELENEIFLKQKLESERLLQQLNAVDIKAPNWKAQMQTK